MAALGVVAALIAALMAGVAPSPAAAQVALEVTEAQQVRTVWTSEFGIDNPRGLAHDPVRGELLVAGDTPDGTRLLRLGSSGDAIGDVVLPDVARPATLAFDAFRDVLTALEAGELIEVSGDALASGEPEVQRSQAPDLGIDGPRSASYDERDGTWFVLGTDSVAILRDPAGPALHIDLDQFPQLGPLAFNPGDGLLYVMTSDHRLLIGLDVSGRQIGVYDMAGVELTDPVAMAFAPSTDPTDDPAIMNVFVADSGGAALGGVTEVSLTEAAVAAAAPVETGTLVQTIDTSIWSPASPDPSGVVWVPGTDELLVVDSEVDETTGAGFHDVNLWRSTLMGTVVGTGTFWGPNAANGGFSKEPTGAGYDPATNTLFVSDDSASKVWVIETGADQAFGTADDVVGAVDSGALGSGDTEDPEFVQGILYFLDGVAREIFRIDPVDGVFGNGNDQTSQFDISHLGPTDFEGLSSSPGRGTLYVGANVAKQVFEIATDGTLIRTIDLSGISAIKYVSGLTVAPASNGSGDLHFYIVDRRVDNGSDPNENDGRIFEVAASDLGGGPPNEPPVAGDDSATTEEDTSVTVDVLANDSDPDGDPLSVTNLVQPAHGTAVANGDGTVTYTPDLDWFGSDSFTYSAFDGWAASSPATVSVTVSPVNDPPNAQDDWTWTSTDTSVVIAVLANDADPDGDALDLDSVTQPGNGSALANVDGTVTYTPAAGFEGDDVFTYQVCDGAPSCSTATVTVTVGDVTIVQSALGETTVAGSVVAGTFATTHVLDGAFEQLVEARSGGRPASRTSYLEHRWNFDVVGGEAVTFVVQAYRPANAENDDFVFEYSTDGGSSFSPLAVVNTTASTEYRVALSSATSGPLVVRVRDTNTTAGNSATDSVYVDYLAVETLNPQAPQASVTVAATDAAAAETGDTGTFTFTRNDAAGPLTVDYAVSGGATPGVDYETLAGFVSFAPGQAQADVIVTPIDDALAEGDESVVVTLIDRAEYTVGQPDAATVVIGDDEQAATEARALSEVTSNGTITSGSYLSTHFDDGVREVIREESYGGNQRTRLEHAWSFSVQGGSQVQFLVQAYHDGAENFVLSYSANGSGWVDMMTISKTSDDGTYQTFALPAGTSGTVSVRVLDVNRSRGDATQESVFVDAMYILSTP